MAVLVYHRLIAVVQWQCPKALFLCRSVTSVQRNHAALALQRSEGPPAADVQTESPATWPAHLAAHPPTWLLIYLATWLLTHLATWLLIYLAT